VTTDDSDSQTSDLIISDRALKKLAQRLTSGPDRDQTIQIIQSLLLEIHSLDVIDLWEPREAALTYWILMLTAP
jgi:hypothetical protein